MRALLFILFFPFSFFGHDDGKELLDMALDKCERPGKFGRLPGHTFPVPE